MNLTHPQRRLPKLVLSVAGVVLSALLVTAPAWGTNDPVLLVPEDVRLYLNVLTRTAERVEHPTPEDRAASVEAEIASERRRSGYDGFAARHRDGSKPTPEEIRELNASNPSPADVAAIAHVHALQRAPDSLIIREGHVDARRYQRVKGIIERIVVIEKESHERDEEKEGRERELRPRDPSDAHPAPLAGVDARNASLLRPYMPRIRRLLHIVLQGRELDSD